MRFLLVLPLAAATLTAALAQRADAPRPIVILVHGRGQLGQDTASLRREWKRDLDSSLKAVGLAELADQDVRLAWYADILDIDSDSACATPRVSDDSLTFGDLARGFLGFLAAGGSENESREMRGLIGELLYAVDPARRCAAERRVGDVIDHAAKERRPVVVVAYSLGSLVAYGALHSRSSVDKDEDIRLLTVGSPLGVRPIREMVFGEIGDTLRAPIVRAWENVYDRDDMFAGPLEGMTLPRTHDQTTHRAGSDDPHNLGRYLRDPATGSAILHLLCQAPRRTTSAACDREQVTGSR